MLLTVPLRYSFCDSLPLFVFKTEINDLRKIIYLRKSEVAVERISDCNAVSKLLGWLLLTVQRRYFFVLNDHLLGKESLFPLLCMSFVNVYQFVYVTFPFGVEDGMKNFYCINI